ncbi:MAG: LEA type 2 family protein [Deltaproteobacteria bacterium]|nr:LEA type 2 family protein [Deltaproteobacteria bacterium]
MRIANRFPLFIFLLAASLAAVSCRALIKDALKPPKVRVAKIILASDPVNDPKGPLAFLLTLEVDNRNDYPLTVTRVAYFAVIGRDTVAEGDHGEEIRIEASRVTTVQVPVAIRTDAFREAMRQVLQARRLDYEFNGSVTFSGTVLGTVRIPFSKTGNLDAADLLKKKGF